MGVRGTNYQLCKCFFSQRWVTELKGERLGRRGTPPCTRGRLNSDRRQTRVGFALAAVLVDPRMGGASKRSRYHSRSVNCAHKVEHYRPG